MQRKDEAAEACAAALQLNPRSIEAMLVRASIKENAEDFDGAIADLKAALEWEENSQRIKDRILKAERLLKQSKKRNYYKILGLPRNCKKKDITKAYRTLAMEWHPDKFSGEEEKKVAEAKFMDIAAAKEVLTDEKLRARFDNGEDPLDAEENSNRGGGGNGGWPFGHGGGQQFHFRH
jgi:DnaJ homolog subfamily C member 3